MPVLAITAAVVVALFHLGLAVACRICFKPVDFDFGLAGPHILSAMDQKRHALLEDRFGRGAYWATAAHYIFPALKEDLRTIARMPGNKLTLPLVGICWALMGLLQLKVLLIASTRTEIRAAIGIEAALLRTIKAA